MEVQVSKENICINKLVAEKKELIFVNSDMIVPDSKPDILNTINVTGNICLYKKIPLRVIGEALLREENFLRVYFNRALR